MKHQFTNLLAHIRNEETNKDVEMVKCNPVLITMEDEELRLCLLHHALFNKAPFYVISTFVDHWLLLEDLQSLSEMQLVHLACIHNEPFDVIHYLSSLFPESLTSKNIMGYTPLIYALEKKRDEDIIQCVS
jgi:ankyrin repeat protein